MEIIRDFFSLYKQRNVGALVLLRQILFTGVDAAGLIIFSSFVIASLIIVQVSEISPNLSQSQMVMTILVTVITRELATFIPALIIIARSGTAIASELGNMVINNEIESIISFGISPISYLVVPRVFGVIMSIFPLAIFFNAAGYLGSGLVLQSFYDVDFLDFITRISAELKLDDLLKIFIKSVIFGFIIGVVSSFNGLSVQKASTEVPQRTSKAVVQGFAGIIVFDIIIALLFNL